MLRTCRSFRWGRILARIWMLQSISLSRKRYRYHAARLLPLVAHVSSRYATPSRSNPRTPSLSDWARRACPLQDEQFSVRCWQTDDFVEDFVYISQEAARYLAVQQVQTVGVDYLSVGGFFKDGVETHHALLEAGIWIIEGLNLSNVEPGIYELVCLPLKMKGSDGAPSRAILRFVEAI